MAKKKADPGPSEPYAPDASPKPRSSDLPGMVGDGVAKPQVPALDEAVVEYVEHRDKRIAAGVEEKSRKKLVLALMERHNLASYEVDDLVVVKKPKDDTASIKVVAKADYLGTPTTGDAEED
jgi:hypothetical protein